MERTAGIVCITDKSFDDITYFDCSIDTVLDRNDYDAWWDVYYELGRRAYNEAVAKYGDEVDGELTWKAINMKLRSTEFSCNGDDVVDYMAWHEGDIERIIFDVWDILTDEDN